MDGSEKLINGRTGRDPNSSQKQTPAGELSPLGTLLTSRPVCLAMWTSSEPVWTHVGWAINEYKPNNNINSGGVGSVIETGHRSSHFAVGGPSFVTSTRLPVFWRQYFPSAHNVQLALKTNKTDYVRINAILRRVRANIVAVKRRRVLHTLSVFLGE